MSLERALGIIDSLLEVLDEADKRQSHTKESCTKAECKKETTTAAPAKPFEYFTSLDDIEESQLVQITSDFALLQEKWKVAGLAENGKGEKKKGRETRKEMEEKKNKRGKGGGCLRKKKRKFKRKKKRSCQKKQLLFLRNSEHELKEFCDQIGKVVEIESSDDTLQIQWENYDTCWVPAFACGVAFELIILFRAPSGAKLTIPGTNNSWLNEGKAVGAEYDEEQKQTNEDEDERYLANSEDTAVIIGNTVRVTKDLALLEERWKSSDLGPHDKISAFLGAVGAIQEINEDNDSVRLQWKNEKSNWIPVQACLVCWLLHTSLTLH
ncbi:hypothetical protein RFI_16194 [Reticulomyxa filosa]|uniref:Uncharacterized protein n=1 Tax=Reticulomyxa filosa TaxID=46433 RepID=X6N505_RETFI|nr:hypothetical protein RFI_16194 [Reticulomyxa filosa]|eukprot:ETO21008.1 hypothetical protein RFI_16194 [Reticulomyxa filosa]